MQVAKRGNCQRLLRKDIYNSAPPQIDPSRPEWADAGDSAQRFGRRDLASPAQCAQMFKDAC
jgi:hypothetical protein